MARIGVGLSVGFVILASLAAPTGHAQATSPQTGFYLAGYLGLRVETELLQLRPEWSILASTPEGWNHGWAMAEVELPSGEPALDGASVPDATIALAALIQTKLSNGELDSTTLPVYRFSWGPLAPADLQFLEIQGILQVGNTSSATIYRGPGLFVHVQCSERALCESLANGVRHNILKLTLLQASMQSHSWQIAAFFLENRHIPIKMSVGEAEAMYVVLDEVKGLEALRVDLTMARSWTPIGTASLDHWLLAPMDEVQAAADIEGWRIYDGALAKQSDFQTRIQRANELSNNEAALDAAGTATTLALWGIALAILAILVGAVDIVLGQRRARAEGPSETRG